VQHDQNDVISGRCLAIGELEGARPGKERTGGDSLRNQQAPQEASNESVISYSILFLT